MEEKKKATPTTKVEKVLAHLKANRSGITSIKAFELYHVTRLSAIIFNLKKKYAIGTTMETCTNEEGQTSRFARYYLMEEGDFLGN